MTNRIASAEDVIVDGESTRSRLLFGLAATALAAGFPSLTMIDGRAENGWTWFACSAVLAGYTLLGASIFLRRD